MKYGMFPGIGIGAGSAAATTPDGYIFGMIRNGRGLMPTYNRIEEPDRWDIINYLRSLQGKGTIAADTSHGRPGETGALVPGASTHGTDASRAVLSSRGRRRVPRRRLTRRRRAPTDTTQEAGGRAMSLQAPREWTPAEVVAASNREIPRSLKTMSVAAFVIGAIVFLVGFPRSHRSPRTGDPAAESMTGWTTPWSSMPDH